MPYERRQFIRVVFDAPARLITAQGVVQVRVLDMSLRGALVAVPDPSLLRSGSLCRLDLLLGSALERIAMRMHVAHVMGQCVGLRCKATDLDSATHLRRLIELQLGNASLLERDLAELVAGAPPLGSAV